jgi:protein-disulfide isomerase
MRIFLVFIFLLVSSNAAFAQTNGDVLAKIGNQNVTVADLDAEAQAARAQLSAEIAALRKRELEAEINQTLLANEADARKISVEKLLDAEVRAKIGEPSVEQINAVYEANRAALGNVSLEEARPRIANFLRRERQNELTSEFAAKLKTKYKVALGAPEATSANLKPTDVLATVAGKSVTAANFLERLKPLEYDLHLQAYQAAKAALDRALYSALILKEAAASNVAPEDVVRRDVTEKIGQPSETDARKFYDERRAQIPAHFEAVKTQIISYLADEQRQRLENALTARLAAKHSAQILLREPPAPVLKISVDDDPAVGAANAPVTVVMFTDLQCPACARTHPVLKAVLQNYAGKTRFVVRDYPLTELHPQAFRAAEAANAAHAQAKFFEFIEILYQNQKALDDASLEKYAAQIGLDARRFKTDLTSGRFADEIRKDQRDGAFYGINSTPTVFVNGVRVNDLSAENFKAAIEKALTKK